MASAASKRGSEGVVIKSKSPPNECLQFTLSIEDFAKVKKSKDLLEAIETRFEMGYSIGCPVTLKAYLTLEEKDASRLQSSSIGIFFRFVDDNDQDGEAPRKILLTADVKFGNVEKRLSAKMGQTVGWPGFITEYTTLPLDAQGSLPIDINLTLYNLDGRGLTVADMMLKHKSNFHQNLTEDLERMYKEPGHFAPGVATMITVVSKDVKKLPSNSNMLAARSPVFQTMFQTPMKEAKEGVVNIDDIGGDALEVFLHFMHTGVLLDSWREPEILEELTCAAHKYLRQDLLDFLDEAIGLLCTPENCLKMARVAQRLELKNAETALLKMVQNKLVQKCKLATSLEEMAKLLQE